jgi:hypothetical protein
MEHCCEGNLIIDIALYGARDHNSFYRIKYSPCRKVFPVKVVKNTETCIINYVAYTFFYGMNCR